MLTMNTIRGTNFFIYEKNNSLSSGSSSPYLSCHSKKRDSSDSDVQSPQMEEKMQWEISSDDNSSSSNSEREISSSFRSSLFVGGDEDYYGSKSFGHNPREEDLVRTPDYLPLDYFHSSSIQGGGASFPLPSSILPKPAKGFGLTKSEQEFKDLIQRFPVSKSMEDLAAKSSGIDLFATPPPLTSSSSNPSSSSSSSNSYSTFPPVQQSSFVLENAVKHEAEDLCVVNSESGFYYQSTSIQNKHSSVHSSHQKEERYQPPPPPLPHPHSLSHPHSHANVVHMEEDNGMMEKFPDVRVTDFKHVIYNLLVDNYNHSIHPNPDPHFIPIVEPARVEDGNGMREGFVFRDEAQPERILPELYSTHIRNAPLEKEDPSSIFIQDLYKYYLRSCVELLSKYFEKKGKYTFLYEDVPLFLPGSSLRDAEKRMKLMKTRARMQKKRKNST